MGSLVTILGIGMVALPSGILASAFSEQMRRKRSRQWVIDDAMEDGEIDSRELNLIRNMGDQLGLSEEQIEDLVEHSRHILTKHPSDKEDS